MMRIMYKSITDIIDEEHGIDIPAGTEMVLLRMSSDGVTVAPIGLERYISLTMPSELFDKAFRLEGGIR